MDLPELVGVEYSSETSTAQLTPVSVDILVSGIDWHFRNVIGISIGIHGQ